MDLKDYLSSSLVAPDAASELHGYIKEAFGRVIATLELIPDGQGKLLEIGANPYFLTLLVKKFRTYDISMTNYFGHGSAPGKQCIRNEKYNETHEFEFESNNIEKEPLPFPADHFDVVLCCEVIEHLIENPVFALHNLHRVLKPGGTLILSTPNVFRYANLKKFVLKRKHSIYDPYSGYGIYGRHNREYSLFELQDLLSKTGYTILKSKTIFSHKPTLFKRLLEKMDLGSYLLVKAQKNREFNWYYPEYLFRSGTIPATVNAGESGK